MSNVLPPERWEEYGKPDPEMAKHLEENPIVSLGSWGNAEGCRKGMNEMVFTSLSKFPAPDLSDVHQEEFQIPTRDGHKMRAVHMRPKSLKADAPLIVIYHGGGFVAGVPEYDAPLQIAAAQNFGASSITIDYRMAPEFRFPYAINDSWDGLKWCVENKEKLRADPTKGFILAGASAGANIAAVLALMARDEGLSPPITGVSVDCLPATAPGDVPHKYKSQYKSYTQNANAPLLDKLAFDWFLGEYHPEPGSHLMSPLIWPGGHKNHPPIYFTVMGQDVLRDDSLIYEKMLREEYGVKTKIDVYPGLFHTFPGFRPETSHTMKVIQNGGAGMAWLLQGAP